ncbi:MAG: hypothetical protein ACR2N7_12485 [Acidimicrobiia bacterium]
MRRLSVLVGAVLLVGAACTTTPATTTTTTRATTTTAAPTTTVAPATTTTVPPTTTTTTPQETTTTSTPTTTTEPTGPVLLSGEGVLAGEFPLPYGTDDEVTIATITAILGEPSHDSGWIDSFSGYGTCPGPLVRGVEWGSFTTLYTVAGDEFAAEGVEHFFSYYYTSDDPHLETTEGVAIGSTNHALEAGHGGPTFVLTPWFFDETLGFWSSDQFSSEQLWGLSTGLNPTDTVMSINGGQGCGE